MASVAIQDMFGCAECKAAADIYGRMCKHGAMFPVLLLLAGKETCPNYVFDKDKVEEQLNGQ